MVKKPSLKPILFGRRVYDLSKAHYRRAFGLLLNQPLYTTNDGLAQRSSAVQALINRAVELRDMTYTPIPQLTKSDKARFWAKVVERGPEECWEWTAHKIKYGYGRILIGSRLFLAHRISLFLKTGHVPPDMCVMHTCDNPPCCNPSHLRAATIKENNLDCVAKNRVWRGTGKLNPRAKLTENQVKEIRLDKISSDTVLARKYSVSRGAIWFIKSNNSWRDLV